MKLSDLDPKDVTPVKKAGGGLRLSDVHPDEVKSVSKASESSDLKDLGIGVGQGATLGFGDEILGGLQAGGDVLTGDTDLSDIGTAYRKHQKDNEGGVDAAKARSPYLTTAGEIAGGLLPALLSGGASEAATGLNVTKSLGQLALKGAATGAGLGSVAGLGGSHGTIEGDPSELIKDSAFGAGGGALLGGAMPYAGEALKDAGKAVFGANASLSKAGDAIKSVASKPLNALAQLIEDSPTLRNLNDARKLKAATGDSFTGTKNVQRVNDEINSTVDDLTSHIYDVKPQANSAYGEGLSGSAPTETASSEPLKAFNEMVNGKSSGLSPEEYDHFLTLGATPEQLASEFSKTSGRGGMTVEGKALLEKAATKGGLNAQETKTLQNLINEAKMKPGFADTNVPGDAADALNPLINESLPAEDLARINAEYSGKLSSAEPFLNNGEVNPALQKNRFSDTDSTDARNKIADFLSSVVKKSRDPNVSGAETNANFQRALGTADTINAGLEEPLLDTSLIKGNADAAALKANIVKSIYGERAYGQTPSLTGGIVDKIAGAPMRAALGAGAIQRGTGKIVSGVAENSRNLFKATNEGLSYVVQQLTGAGHVDIANSLTKALTAEDPGAKNAALFTIMQNPAYRKAVFGDDKSEGTK